MIDLTPLEVRKKKGDFRRAMRGYEPALVDDFLDIVADRLEQVVRDNLSLGERVARADQQVAEYRDRERALTEALVTAQEMREEMRQQTAREIDLARRTAEQEAAQLRSSAQQEVDKLRSSARTEVDALRLSAREEASQLRSTAIHEREREEEAVRRLRSRQQQFMTTYRGFLEREIAELSVMDRTFEIAGATALASPATAPVQAPAPVSVVESVMEMIVVTQPVPAHVERGSVDTDAIADAYFTETQPEASSATSEDLSLADLDDLEPVAEDDDDLSFEFTEPFEPEPFEEEPVVAEADEDELEELDALDTFEDDEEDELTAALLRNAAAAGYKVPEDDELLLDDAVSDTAAEPKPKPGWLPGLLDDEAS